MQTISFLLLSLLVFLLQPVLSLSYENRIAGEPLTDKDKKTAVEHLNMMQRDINSIRAKAVQTKKNNLLQKDITVEGEIMLKRPNLLRWAITKPEKTIITADKEKMTVYHPDAKEAEIYALSENITARNMINFFSSSIDLSLEELEKMFSVNIYRNSKNIIFELKPKSKIVSRYLVVVYIWYAEKSGLPSEFEITGTRGDKTHLWLNDIVVNPDLNADMFHITLPDGVVITNKMDTARTD